jgi:hypothetical protein
MIKAIEVMSAISLYRNSRIQMSSTSSQIWSILLLEGIAF